MPRKCYRHCVKTVSPENNALLRDCRPLSREFFNAPPEQVARALLGKVLVRKSRGTFLSGRIVETEAYLGEHDPAAHAASGRTSRNFVLFGPPGHAYVYSIYGLHYCLNVSCLPEGTAGCVLLRAVDPLMGMRQMRRNRKLSDLAPVAKIASGPGKLCQAFGVTRAADNDRDLILRNSPLCICDDGFQCGEISATPRIGIRKAADLPLRFFLATNRCVSARRH